VRGLEPVSKQALGGSMLEGLSPKGLSRHAGTPLTPERKHARKRALLVGVLPQVG
jgi:hypothetical protein